MATTRPPRDRLRSRLGLRAAGVAMTAEEFDATPPADWDARYRYELIRGTLVVTPPVGDAEADPNDDLGYLLRAYRETHPLGSALDATMPERTVPTTANRRRCDRAVWVGLGRLPDTGRDVPALVVEFVSPQRRDALRAYEQKRDEYLACGVAEYWVIDRFRRLLTISRRGPFGPTHEVVAEGQDYTTDLLPGFALPLARLLGRADRWRRARPQRRPAPPAGGIDG